MKQFLDMEMDKIFDSILIITFKHENFSADYKQIALTQLVSGRGNSSLFSSDVRRSSSPGISERPWKWSTGYA